MSSTKNILSDLETQGFAILPNAFSPSQLSVFRAAAAKTTTRARQGGWPHLRTLPKQFPPWGTTPGEEGIWGVQHLLHPDLGADADAFAECYFSDVVVDGVKEALGLEGEGDEDMLVMELFNMLVRPDRDFQLKWHRDDVSFQQSREEEAKALGVDVDAERGVNGGQELRRRHAFHAQYNIPLYPDRSLHVVPGSHRRPRTEAEAQLLAADAYASELPGMVEVAMQPGDVVFYDNNIIHRGVYDAGVERMTLHGSVGDVRGGNARARNVLQHGVGGWVARCQFDKLHDGAKQERAEKMRQKLVELGSAAGDVGYSHEED